jgi:hypothetical protein
MLLAGGPGRIVRGPRPVVGTVINELDGTRHPIRTDLVIEAGGPNWVPRLVPPGTGVGPAHRARISFLGWSPLIAAESPGIWLQLPGAASNVLAVGRPTLLVSGTVVHLGAGTLRLCLLDPAIPAATLSPPHEPAPGRRSRRHVARHARTARHRR